MASKPTEMCVVEKSGAREYKVMCSSFFRLPDESKRVVLEEALSSIAIALRLLVFFLSLSAVVVALSPSLPLDDDVWRLREEVERLARSVRATTISSSAVPSSQKLGAKRRAPPGNDWIDEKSVFVVLVDAQPLKIARNSIAPLETRANALEPSLCEFGVGNGFVRANRARRRARGGGWVVVRASMTKRRVVPFLKRETFDATLFREKDFESHQ